MELGNIDHAPSTTANGHPVASIILYAFSWVFILISEASADDIWKWGWRGLSAISLALIIYINWNKAKEVFKSKKNKI